MAVVTGSSKGMGASIAKCFKADSTKFAVNYSTSKEDAEKVTKAITDNSSTEIFGQTNVSQETNVTALLEETKNALGKRRNYRQLI